MKLFTTTDFYNFFSNNKVICKLPFEKNNEHYLLLNIYATESATGLNDYGSGQIEQNWELTSEYYNEKINDMILVFEVWANDSAFSFLPGSIDYRHRNSIIEIPLGLLASTIF